MAHLIKDHPFSIASLTSPVVKKPEILQNNFLSNQCSDRNKTPSKMAGKLDKEASASFNTSPVSCAGSLSIDSEISFCSVETDPSIRAETSGVAPARSSSPATSDDSGCGSPPPLPVSPVIKEAIQDGRPSNTSEDPSDKPPHSYIALISMAILESADKKLVLSDIYQFIMDNFAYYNNQERAWRNSIRHNLSLNECFIKAGRADNGKGNFWAIHPACVEDFSKGDFRRRQARRRARANVASADHMAAYALRCANYLPLAHPVGSDLHHPLISANGAPPAFPYLHPVYSSMYPSASLPLPLPAALPLPALPSEGSCSMAGKIPVSRSSPLVQHHHPYLSLSPVVMRSALSGGASLSVSSHAVSAHSSDSTPSVRYAPYARLHHPHHPGLW